jgi:bla regulator protein BlaR1
MIGTLTNHLWQSTLFAIAVGLLTIAFRKNRAQVRYWLWFSASLKWVVPFTLLMSLGSHLEWGPAAKKIAPPAVSTTIEQMAEPFTGISAPTPSRRGSSTAGTPLLILSLWGVWLAGLGTIVLIRLRTWRRIGAIVRKSAPLEIPAMAIPPSVQLRSAPGLLEPGVVGWLRPILLLPADIVGRLTPRQLEAVLAHELCHVRRRDNFTSAIHMIVEAVFWFIHSYGGSVRGLWTSANEPAMRKCCVSVMNRWSMPKEFSMFVRLMWNPHCDAFPELRDRT